MRIGKKIYLRITKASNSNQLGALAGLGIVLWKHNSTILRVDPGVLPERALDPPKNVKPFDWKQTVIRTDLVEGSFVELYFTANEHFKVRSDGVESSLFSEVNPRNYFVGFDITANISEISLYQDYYLDNDHEKKCLAIEALRHSIISSERQHELDNYIPIQFHSLCSKSVSLHDKRRIAIRHEHDRHEHSSSLIFLDCYLQAGDAILVRIVALEPCYARSILFGCMTLNDINELSETDLLRGPDDFLSSTPYYPVLTENVMPLASLKDHYLIELNRAGDIQFKKNDKPTDVQMSVFPDSEPYRPFFCLNGFIVGIQVLGLRRDGPSASLVKQDLFDFGEADADGGESAHECIICQDKRASCVFIPCGHLIACTDCSGQLKQSGLNTCPTCRTPYEDIWEVNSI
ncbi:unnamed protein product [Didymodactylos carnosus]|uniref:RING-type domain-containing protein n=1 Tax=Didymodactylos carnosus TaxID=1234261 RepID=A0A814AXI2_9BILA|nr:unnamed protein product [Didymodactylos carnosus]CAF1150274.1 unnamed protein product [Didymodactylos carnosus]CAF3698638.1 unnamed protein product [Didymodactylos carnosus]CAF3956482.1 unnamed protein product [Didymodactylos carnosus]